MSLKWLNRTLVFSPYCFALCLDEQSFRRELRKLGLPRDEWPEFLGSKRANATAHFLEQTDNSQSACIVCLGDVSRRSQEEVYGLLVHEAVHIWQAIKQDIGERSPSSEFEAYSIQAIAQQLMTAFAEAQTPKKARNRKKG